MDKFKNATLILEIKVNFSNLKQDKLLHVN